MSTARELELGLKVHEVFAAATRNSALQDMTSRLYEQLRAALWLAVVWLDSWDDAVAQHREIVDAILARSVARAVRAAREHVRDSLRNMARVEQLYENAPPPLRATSSAGPPNPDLSRSSRGNHAASAQGRKGPAGSPAL